MGIVGGAGLGAVPGANGRAEPLGELGGEADLQGAAVRPFVVEGSQEALAVGHVFLP
jgi:hypothetical protein